MSLLGDMVKTAADAARLATDVTRLKLEEKKKAAKRGAIRIGICLGMGLVALGFVGAGIGLLLYGSFVLVAHKIGPGWSGFVIGVGCFLLAGLLLLVACAPTKRS